MRQIVLIFICVSMFGVSNAQISYGVKGGLNLSHDVWHDLTYVSKFKTGFHAGGFAGFPIAGKLSIQLELMYSAQGSKSSYVNTQYEKFTDDNGQVSYLPTYTHVDSISTLHYLNFPVLIKCTTGSGFYGETGPQGGFLMAVKTTPAHDNTFGFNDRVDFSWVFGIGYKSSSKFGIDLRYNFGLTSLFWESGRYVNNNALQLGLSYALRRK